MKLSKMLLIICIVLAVYDRGDSSLIDTRSFEDFEVHVKSQKFSFKEDIMKDIQHIKRLIMIARLHRRCQKTNYADLCNSLQIILLHGSFTEKQYAKKLLVELQKLI